MTTALVTDLSRRRVRDAMHDGVLVCSSDTSLRAVAAMMAERRVHAIAVNDAQDGSQPWGIVTALDVAAAAGLGLEATARDAVLTDVVTIASDERLDAAARAMDKHDRAHLLVVDPSSRRPVGMLSALDIVRAYGR